MRGSVIFDLSQMEGWYKKPGCLGYRGDYTTHLINIVYKKPLWGSLLTNQFSWMPWGPVWNQERKDKLAQTIATQSELREWRWKQAPLAVISRMLMYILNTDLGGGFKYFFFFTPIWGRFPIWLIFFRWVGEPTTNQWYWMHISMTFRDELKQKPETSMYLEGKPMTDLWDEQYIHLTWMAKMYGKLVGKIF